MMPSSGRSRRLLIRAEEEGYRDVFEGFEDFDRALKAVEDFIKLVKDPRISGYVKRAEAEKILEDLDEFRRRSLDVVGKPADMLYGSLKSLILRILRGSWMGKRVFVDTVRNRRLHD